MSLTLALQAALSGLNASQAALQVTSNNIANVNTVGYTRKVAQFASQTLEGVGSGVSVARVSRQVDEFLLEQVRGQKATTGRYDVQEQFLTQLEAFFGSPESDRTISTALTELKTELEAVGLTPELDANRFTAVGEAKQLVQLISELASTVQQMRLDADNQVTQYVGRADDLLEQIVDLNVQISRARATGTNDTDLRDQRDRVLGELSDIIDIKAVENQAGQLVIFTSGGQTILSGALKEDLSHTTAIQLGPDTYYTDPNDSGYPGAI
ncbi:MAG: flagellar hook-associated protein FlgK, partial [Alphaproteobacteria bacterium]